MADVHDHVVADARLGRQRDGDGLAHAAEVDDACSARVQPRRWRGGARHMIRFPARRRAAAGSTLRRHPGLAERARRRRRARGVVVPARPCGSAQAMGAAFAQHAVEETAAAEATVSQPCSRAAAARRGRAVGERGVEASRAARAAASSRGTSNISATPARRSSHGREAAACAAPAVRLRSTERSSAIAGFGFEGLAHAPASKAGGGGVEPAAGRWCWSGQFRPRPASAPTVAPPTPRREAPAGDLARRGRPSAAAAMRQGSRAATSPPADERLQVADRRQRWRSPPSTHNTRRPRPPSVPRPTPSSARPITGPSAVPRPSPRRCAHGGAARRSPARQAGSPSASARRVLWKSGAGRARHRRRLARAALAEASSARQASASPRSPCTTDRARPFASSRAARFFRKAPRRARRRARRREREGFGHAVMPGADASATDPGVQAGAGLGRHQQHLDARIDARAYSMHLGTSKFRYGSRSVLFSTISLAAANMSGTSAACPRPRSPTGWRSWRPRPDPTSPGRQVADVLDEEQDSAASARADDRASLLRARANARRCSREKATTMGASRWQPRRC